MKKASDYLKFYPQDDGPTISTCTRKIIEKDGLLFKDIGGDGVWKDYDDWRLSPKKRAELLVSDLSIDEKIGLLFVNSWKTGMEQTDKSYVDETGLLDEKPQAKGESIFATEATVGTTETLKNWFVRNLILRSNPLPAELTDWINELNRVAEECPRFIPVKVLANSKNENGKVIFGMNDGNSGFTTWPGTLGIAAAVNGGNIELIEHFAKCVFKEWNTVGLRKGYMYMADVATDPRWQRTYGTFGESPQLVSSILERLIPIIQGDKQSVTKQGVALTIKHFPGGGARENGFDPHYAMGQWNIYPTEGSLIKYHLPSFKTAIDYNVSSIMPYYAKPSAEKSAKQVGYDGEPLVFTPFGFAFNQYIMQNLLREQMHFKGYINSDSGIVHRMSWGVENLDLPERVACALNTGVDVISGSFDLEAAKEAYQRSLNNYYDAHAIPQGFTKEQLVLTEATINRAVSHTLEESFRLGMFENPYRSRDKTIELFEKKPFEKYALEAHQKSIVLLKNDGTLPLNTKQKETATFYVEVFKNNQEEAQEATADLKAKLSSYLLLTDDSKEADYAILFVDPASGGYFEATRGYLELDICEDKEVVAVDELGCPSTTTIKETTLVGVLKIHEIFTTMHEHQGKVISNLNITLPWLPRNIEENCDCLLSGFDTYISAYLDIIFGKASAFGKLPLTLPRSDDVIAVNSDGTCVSPNDVPGYDKDQYIDDKLKDENGKAYAYKDSAGNYYEFGFGLSYSKNK